MQRCSFFSELAFLSHSRNDVCVQTYPLYILFFVVSSFTKEKKLMEAAAAVLHKKEEKKSKACPVISYLLMRLV